MPAVVRLSAILDTVLHGGIGFHASAFLDTAIVVLLTPVARLLVGIYVSARVRDWLYVAIGVLVVAGVVIGQFGV